MGAVESQIMTNIIAAPRTMNKIREKHGRQRVDICRVTVPASPGAGWLLRLTRLKAHDVITSIKHLGGADANMSDCNVGIYTPSSSTTDPVAVDDNGLVEAADLKDATATPTEILGTGLTNYSDFGKALWEYAGGGPAAEPDQGTEYEIVIEVVGDAVGCEKCFLVEYLAGD